MASDQTLRAIITVLDRTSEPLRQINARFASMSSPIRQIGSRIGELGELTGLANIGTQAKNALEHVRGLGQGLLSLAGPLAALGAAGSVAGLVEIAKSTAEFAEKLDIGAAMTGIATDQLAGWHYAAGLVNVDVTRLDRGFTFLNRNIAQAAMGKAKEVQQILTHMGLTNTPGHLTSTAAALSTVAAEVKHLVDTGQTAMATNVMAQLFGARSGAQLLPLFEQGPEKIKEILAGAQEAGISLTAAQTAAGHEFMESFKGMQASVEGVKLAIGNDLFPLLTPMIESMRQWLNANREWIATNLGDAVHYLADGIRSIDWAAVGADIRGLAKDAKWLVHEVGGIGPAMLIVAGISMAPTIAAFASLGGAVAAAAGKFLLFPVGALVADFISLIPAIGGAADMFAALDVAMDANPIGVIILAATALGVAAYEVYEHWKPIAAFFREMWDDISGVFERGWAHVKPIVDALKEAASWVGLHGGGGDIPVDGGLPAIAARTPLSAQPGAAAAAGGGTPGGGLTQIIVDLRNLPKGSTVSTESRGNATPPDVNVGWAFPP